jgi:ribosomal protein S21
MDINEEGLKVVKKKYETVGQMLRRLKRKLKIDGVLIRKNDQRNVYEKPGEKRSKQIEINHKRKIEKLKRGII